MTWQGDIVYGGNTLSSANISAIVTCANRYNLLPTGIICQLYLESHWGNAGAGSNHTLNNWGGITYTGTSQFPSYINYERGTARPSNEGGYYVRFATMNDFFLAFGYLVGAKKYGGRGIYNCSDKTTVYEYGRGLTVEGGAKYNYARSWQNYVSTMASIEKGIKSNYSNFDEINTGVIVTTYLGLPLANLTPSQITTKYGWRTHPISGAYEFHQAIDFSASCGSSIFASLGGTIEIAEKPNDSVDGNIGSYGNHVRINHGNGYKTLYAHMWRVNVNVGDVVSANDVIGTVGSTGSSTGCHLHYEFIDESAPLDPKGGHRVDPYPYLFEGKPIDGLSPIPDTPSKKKKFKWWLYLKKRRF